MTDFFPLRCWTALVQRPVGVVIPASRNRRLSCATPRPSRRPPGEQPLHGLRLHWTAANSRGSLGAIVSANEAAAWLRPTWLTPPYRSLTLRPGPVLCQSIRFLWGRSLTGAAPKALPRVGVYGAGSMITWIS
jgi:hypothetical protein